MKNFIEHVIVSTNEVLRELERDHMNTEVPYLADAYKQWMQTNDDKTENVANAYVSYVKSADRELFLYEDDFFYILPQKIKAYDFEGVAALFKQYLAIIDEWLEDSKKEDVGISTKKISDWRSGFRNYQKFIVEYYIPNLPTIHSENKERKKIELPKFKDLYARKDFENWLVKTGKTSDSASKCYASRLKRLNRTISTKFTVMVQQPVDFFAEISNLLHMGQIERAIDLLNMLDCKLVNKIYKKDESVLGINALRNCISALRAYKQFLRYEYIDEISDNEEVEDIKEDVEKEQENIPNIWIKKGECIPYEYEALEENLARRLLSQDRIYKEIFFPIRLIKQLFYRSQKESERQGVSNGIYDWLQKKWVRNCIAEINIITDNGVFTLGQLSEHDALTINPETNEVLIKHMDNDTSVRLLTYTEQEGENPVPLEANDLRQIEIDHVVLLHKILSDNIYELDGLVRLTEMMREVAQKYNLPITPKYTKIRQKMFQEEACLTEMFALIPLLKDDLEFIRNASTLQLMGTKYNRKKEKRG